MALAVAIASARIEAQITAADWRRFEARQAAIDGLNYAAWQIAARDSGDTDKLSQYALSINGYDVRFALSEDGEKLDINLASEQTLSSFFEALGLDAAEADKFAARIADWRDADDLARPNGAERRDYALARNGESIGDRPFYSVDELSRVLEAPELIVSCAIPALTIFGDGSPPSAALMKRLYGFNNDGAPEPTRGRLGTASRSGTAGRRYALSASVKRNDHADGRAYTLTGIFRITGRRQQPFEWIAQFEETSVEMMPDLCKDLPYREDLNKLPTSQ